MKKYLVSFILFCSALNLFSLGAFITINQRNHPDLKWQVVESANIKVVYHQPLQAWAEESVKIAEASFAALSQSYGTAPEEKILIYISDRDDIANGATMFDSYFFIYVNSSAYLENFSGTESFLHKVIAHEMSHYFLYHTTADLLAKLIPPLPALTFPKDLNEGFAQYYSGEEWGLQRGDRYLRQAAFNGNLLRPNSEIGGGLLYARGFSLVRYLAEFYGEDKLQQLLLHRNQQNFFDLQAAFEDIYGKSYQRLQQDWRQHILTQYYGASYNRKIASKTDSLFAHTFAEYEKIDYKISSLRSLSIKNNHALILGKLDRDQGYQNLILAEISADSLALGKFQINQQQIFAKLSNAFHLDLSYNGQYAIYSRYARAGNKSLHPTIFRYNAQTGKSKAMFKGSFPQVFDNGDFIYKSRISAGSEIMKFSNFSSSSILSFPRDVQIENLSLSPDQEKFAFALLEDEQYKIKIYDFYQTKLLATYHFDSFPQKILWLDNSALLAVSGDSEDYRTALSQIYSDGSERREYLTPPYNLSPLTAHQDSSGLQLITLADFDNSNNSLGKISLPQLQENFSLPRNTNFFDSWQERPADNQIVLADSLERASLDYYPYHSLKQIKNRMNLLLPIHSGFFVGTLFSEPLGLHYLGGGFYQPYDFSADNYYYLNYTNKMLAPTLSLAGFKLAYPGKYYQEKLYWQNILGVNFSLDFQHDIFLQQFWQINSQLELSYLDIKNYYAKDDDLTDDSGEILLPTGHTIYPAYSLQMGYNLPYKNSQVHPIRKFDLNYQIAVADEKLKLPRTFTQHELELELAWAPLFELFDDSLLKTFSLQNHSRLQLFNGRNPGFYDFQNILYRDQKITIGKFQPRFNFTGDYQEDKYLSLQNEAWLKLSDKLNLSLKLKTELLSITYLGVGGWLDYLATQDLQTDNYEIKENYGYEIKAMLNLLGFNFICRYGDDFDKANQYFNVSLPFALF
ncbi:MAG: hypothetical protein R6U84_09130 [Candidatus Cloacimonadales bacterium]